MQGLLISGPTGTRVSLEERIDDDENGRFPGRQRLFPAAAGALEVDTERFPSGSDTERALRTQAPEALGAHLQNGKTKSLWVI